MNTAIEQRRRVSPLLVGWFGVLLVLLAIGVYGAYLVFTRHEAAHVTWGLLVPSYVFFALGAVGSSIINSIGTIFGVKRFRPIEKRAVLLGLLLIIPPWIYILLDLGKPLQMYNLYLVFHPTSRLAWMGVLYMLFAASVVVELIVVIREEHMPHWAPLVIGVIVLTVELLLLTNLGALFGAVEGKPFWANTLLPFHFLVMAAITGPAFHILFANISYLARSGRVPDDLRRLFSKDYGPMLAGLIIVNFAFFAAKFINCTMSPEICGPYVELLLKGPYSLLFWGLQVVGGGIIPFVILLFRRARESTVLIMGTSVLMLVGIYASVYNLLVAGQSIDPVCSGAIISYLPELGEVLLVMGGAVVCLFLYTLGEVLLPLDPEDEPRWFILGKKR